MTSPCYCAALRRAARRATALYDAALAPTGINVAQFSLLRTVARLAPVSLTDIGRAVDLDRSTVGRNIKLLNRIGLVVLAAGSDQREATVSPTEAGRATIARGAPLWHEAQTRIDASLGAEADQFRALLETFGRADRTTPSRNSA